VGRKRSPWVARPPEKSYLKKTHGMSHKDWWELWTRQGTGCAICGRVGRKLYVDHHHAIGEAGLLRGSVRGLLCWICNSAIAAFREEAEVMRIAADYIDRPPAWAIWPDEPRETDGNIRPSD
jgi:Recombination endonuclease VII